MKGDFDSFNELNASDSDALQVIQNMLFMGLTRMDEQYRVVPYLAESWRFTNGDSVLTYHLRKDVQWSDGEPTTADDVLFTYKLATNPKVAYPAGSRFDLVRDVRIVDDYTIQFILKQPYPDALYDTQIPILPQHILEKIPPEKISECDFNRHPVGNGPFQLVEWKANQSVVFKANVVFALDRPWVDRVVFVIIPDETVLLTNLLTGVLDVVPNLTPVGLRQLKSRNKFQTIHYSGVSYSFIGWNTANLLFDRETRRALTYAIDKQEIIDTLCEGLAEPIIGPFLPFNWAYDKYLQDYPYNPEIARNILEQNGWHDSNGDGYLDRDGHLFEFSLKTNSGSQLRKDVAVMIQAQLKRVGVKVRVQPLEWNLFIDDVFMNKKFDAVISGWDTDFTVNPTDLWHTKAIESGYNFISYRNPMVDALLEKGRKTLDPDKAKPIWADFQKIILDDAPYTFLFTREKLAAFDKRITGVKMDARGVLANITEWWIPKMKRKYHVARTSNGLEK